MHVILARWRELAATVAISGAAFGVIWGDVWLVTHR